MAQKISFGTGLEEFVVNGATTLRFNPTDTDFVNRFQATVDRLKGMQEAFEADMPALSDAVDAALAAEDPDRVSEANRAMMARITEGSDAMRAEVDALFGEGAAAGLFPNNMSLYALSDGMPVWVNFLEAVSDVVADAFEAERGKADPRMAASSKKYKRMLAKYRKQRKG